MCRKNRRRNRMTWLYAMVALAVFTGGPGGQDTFAMSRSDLPQSGQSNANDVHSETGELDPNVETFINFFDRVKPDITIDCDVDIDLFLMLKVFPFFSKMHEDFRIALNLNEDESRSCEETFVFLFDSLDKDKGRLGQFRDFINSTKNSSSRPEEVARQALEILGLNNLITREKTA